MNPFANVIVSFAAGALAAWCVTRMLRRRRMPVRYTDAQLRERVRARLPDLVSHPDAVEVGVEAGIVRVSGRVLARERDGLLSRLTHMPGVNKVHNALSTLDDPSDLAQWRSPVGPGSLQP